MVLKSLNDISEGMVVAKPIVVQGRTLLCVGAQLTAKHLTIFKTWGINGVWVEGDSENDDTLDIDKSEFKEVKELVNERFSKCDSECEVISSLKRIVIQMECVKKNAEMDISAGEN